MRLKITRNESGHHALNRVIAFFSSVIVSIVFVKQAWSRDIDWLEYPAYAAAMLISYAPVLAVKLIYALKGIEIKGPDAEKIHSEDRKGD